MLLSKPLLDKISLEGLLTCESEPLYRIDKESLRTSHALDCVTGISMPNRVR